MSGDDESCIILLSNWTLGASTRGLQIRIGLPFDSHNSVSFEMDAR